MKDGYISKLTITKTGHQATQYKKIMNNLPILCADKNFRYINDVLYRWTDLPEATFLLPYPDSTRWSNTYNIQIKIANPNEISDQVTGECPAIIRLE